MRFTRVPRALASLLLGAGAVLVLAAPTAAVEPIDVRDDGVRSTRPLRTDPPRLTPPAPPAPSRPPAPIATPSPSPTTTPEPLPEYGIDVSYPQCGDELPERVAFAIVGVNGGRVHAPNPCLGADGEDPSLLEWAGREAELYVNTGNPGPNISRFWPDGQEEPRECRNEGIPVGADTLDCAYLYGWNAAGDSYRTALDAYVSLGWADEGADRMPWATTWWLDVESANSWRADRRLNVAALEGALDYLESMEVAKVGFYSTPRMWERITGGTDAFADHPAWHAGASDIVDARERCDEPSFTGGELRMVQWVQDGLDHNIRCS
jgi:hypothetical protein